MSRTLRRSAPWTPLASLTALAIAGTGCHRASIPTDRSSGQPGTEGSTPSAASPTPATFMGAAAPPATAARGYVLGPRSWRNVIPVPEASARALQQTLDRAGAGAIVVAPAGHYEIDAPIVVHADDVLLVGAGSGSLELDSRDDASATVLVRTRDEGSHIRPMLRLVGAHRMQVSGLRFEGVASDGSSGKDVGVQVDDADDFRIDHCYFAHMGFAGVRTNGRSRGVIDHSTFFAEFKAAIGTDGYGVAVYGTDATTGIPLGAAEASAVPEATVIEDCRFARCRHAVASNKGGRYIFRHNYVTSGVIAHAVDAHGAEYHSAVGGEWLDVYENLLEQPNHEPPYYDGWAVRVRGGKGAVHDNVFRGYHVGVELTEETDQPCGPVYVWGNTLEPAGGAMVQTRRTRGSPESVEAAPPGYHPHAYPHPLAAGQCGGRPVTAEGAAEVCRSD